MPKRELLELFEAAYGARPAREVKDDVSAQDLIGQFEAAFVY
jgi:hypothetical protein